MPRSSGQSDFVIRADPDHESAPRAEIELPDEAKVVALPRSIWRTPFASARATRWILGITFVALFALAVLCAVGPHIPSGG